ncbi:MAG: hypothetical protein ACLT0Y_06785 [Christensenellales bacterium]
MPGGDVFSVFEEVQLLPGCIPARAAAFSPLAAGVLLLAQGPNASAGF